MYKPGDLRLLTAPCDEWKAENWCDESCWDAEHGKHEVPDSREKGRMRQSSPGAYLEHSCDEWVIGGPEQVRAMITDLEAALKKMEDGE